MAKPFLTTDTPEVIKNIPALNAPLTFDAKLEPDVFLLPQGHLFFQQGQGAPPQRPCDRRRGLAKKA
jgi:hypothetical protein